MSSPDIRLDMTLDKYTAIIICRYDSGLVTYSCRGLMMEYQGTHPWLTFRLDMRNLPASFWMLLGDACSKCEHIAGSPLLPETASHLHSVYLAKGAWATTSIEGNTLSEEEVAMLARGELDLPPSKQYLGTEVQNVLDACNEMLDDLSSGVKLQLDLERVKYLNLRVLGGIDIYEEAVPGEIRTHSVGVARYRGAPPQDCEYLLTRLCQWLNEMDFDLGHSPLASSIVKSIIAHLYIAWIHPFGDGNGRTARLLEWQLLLNAGVPSPAAHLLSNHYNETRAEYYLRLDRSSRTDDGVVEFLVYALRGLVDGLADQVETIKQQTWQITWTNYVHTRFANRSGAADTRRRHLALDLSEFDSPVPRRNIRTMTPRLAEAYINRTNKTVTRDINVLKQMGLISQTRDGITANKHIVLSFLPVTSSTEDTE